MQSTLDLLGDLRRQSFWLGCLVLLVLGSGMRVLPSRTAGAPMISEEQAPFQLNDIEWVVSEEAAENALAFYLDMQDERYAQACERAIELGWEWQADEDALASGILTPEECERISRAELTAPGGGFVLYEAEVTSVAPPPGAPEPLELAELHGLDTSPTISDLSWLKARGTTQLQCTVFDWYRNLVALRIGNDWKVLLPPPAQYSRRRMLGWFYAWDSVPRVERR